MVALNFKFAKSPERRFVRTAAFFETCLGDFVTLLDGIVSRKGRCGDRIWKLIVNAEKEPMARHYRPQLGSSAEDPIQRLFEATAHMEPADVRALARELRTKGWPETTAKPTAPNGRLAATSSGENGRDVVPALVLDAH
jgi:hypothetical protein